MNPHYSPIHTIKNLGADINFEVARPGNTLEVNGVTIRCAANPHGATTALAFRLEEDGRSLVYAPDAGYTDHAAPPDSAALYRGADLLIHDCTYTPEDHASRRSRGMSSLTDAARVAAAAEVKHLVLFHYDQDYSDDAVDDLVRRTRAELDEQGGQTIELTGAREGLELPV
jgi:ribonuclease BN (tRNA processing enzyme)